MIFFSGHSLSRERKVPPTLLLSPLLKDIYPGLARTDAILATSAAFSFYNPRSILVSDVFLHLLALADSRLFGLPLFSKQLCPHFGLVSSISVHLRSASLACSSFAILFDINPFHYALRKFDKRTRAISSRRQTEERLEVFVVESSDFVGWTSTYTSSFRVSERTDRRQRERASCCQTDVSLAHARQATRSNVPYVQKRANDFLFLQKMINNEKWLYCILFLRSVIVLIDFYF